MGLRPPLNRSCRRFTLRPDNLEGTQGPPPGYAAGGVRRPSFEGPAPWGDERGKYDHRRQTGQAMYLPRPKRSVVSDAPGTKA